MGYYIDKVRETYLDPRHKARQLLMLVEGAKEVKERPITFQPDLVCVVENGMFDAAGYAYSEAEMHAFLEADGRPRRWLTVPDAAKWSGYPRTTDVR